MSSVVFVCKKCYSHSDPLYPGLEIGRGVLWGLGDKKACVVGGFVWVDVCARVGKCLVQPVSRLSLAMFGVNIQWID